MTITSDAAITRPKRALVCGVGGQDGAYLAALLLAKGYEVVGTSRDPTSMNRLGLESLGIAPRVQLASIAPNDFRSVLQTVKRCEPAEIYTLAGQSSVGLSFDQPVETIEGISIGVLKILVAIRFMDLPVRPYIAGSSECFGDAGSQLATESTPSHPRSPYAVAKVCAQNLVANYRDAYGIHASTGIPFNQESPLRPERLVPQKIAMAAARIAARCAEALRLGNLGIHRAWCWVPNWVGVMGYRRPHLSPCDLVITRGRPVSVNCFVERGFRHGGLYWRNEVHPMQAYRCRRTSSIKLHAQTWPDLARVGARAWPLMGESKRRATPLHIPLQPLRIASKLSGTIAARSRPRRYPLV